LFKEIYKVLVSLVCYSLRICW